MKNYELRAARQLLWLTQSEAAEHIGKVSVRSWNYWESGGRIIPRDVIIKIKSLLEKRKEIIKFVIKQREDIKKTNVIFYQTPAYCESVIDWRFSQSIASMLAVDFEANLVLFDYNSYQEFLKKKNLKDSPENRDLWCQSYK